ncbi:hypothetical protein V1507DRAFT_121443 [Lipomyces tetrasporus]
MVTIPLVFAIASASGTRFGLVLMAFGFINFAGLSVELDVGLFMNGARVRCPRSKLFRFGCGLADLSCNVGVGFVARVSSSRELKDNADVKLRDCLTGILPTRSAVSCATLRPTQSGFATGEAQHQSYSIHSCQTRRAGPKKCRSRTRRRPHHRVVPARLRRRICRSHLLFRAPGTPSTHQDWLGSGSCYSTISAYSRKQRQRTSKKGSHTTPSLLPQIPVSLVVHGPGFRPA